MQCRICGNQKNNTQYEAQEMMFGFRDTFSYFQCSGCNCLQIASIPPDMSKYYPDDYISYQPLSQRNHIQKLIFKSRNKYAVFNSGVMGKIFYSKFPNPTLRSLSLISLSKDLTILDVGCGAGVLLDYLRELDFKNLLGIDPYNKKDIQYPNGLKILKKTIHEIEDKWDLIMFHHSFEHIPDPLETLQRVCGLLKPEGICILRIPTVSSYAWKRYGVKWAQLDAPRHFFLHSVESIKMLAGKTGLEVYNLVYDSTSFQFWGSEEYQRDIPHRDERSYSMNPGQSLFSKKEIAAFAKRAEELNAANQGDQAVFYLRKN